MSDESKGQGAAEGSPREGINKTAVAVVGGILLVAGIGLAYYFNVVSDQVIGMLIAGAFVLVLALIVLKVALEVHKPGLRYGIFAFTLGLAAIALYPAKVALHLGRATASETLSEANPALKLPSGGDYRVLVSGHLDEGQGARVAYTLKSGDQSIEGALERQYATRRARRGAAIQVPEDHDLEAHEISVPSGSPQILLDRVTPGHQVKVQAFPMLPPALVYLLMVVVAVAGMFLETRAPNNGSLVMTGAAAVSFGLILKTANPGSMALATLWAAMLAAGGGAVVGTFLGAIGKKIFPAAEPPGAKSRRAKAKDEGEPA